MLEACFFNCGVCFVVRFFPFFCEVRVAFLDISRTGCEIKGQILGVRGGNFLLFFVSIKVVGLCDEPACFVGEGDLRKVLCEKDLVLG